MLLILAVAGVAVLSILHLATNLTSQLKTSRQMLETLKEQLVFAGNEHDELVSHQEGQRTNTIRLRLKSKQVTEELLEQQKKAKQLKHELVSAREDLIAAKKNCSSVTRQLRHQFNVTLRQLHNRVIMDEQYRTLLSKNVEERAQVELSLGSLQDRAFNMTQQLKRTKTQLREAVILVKKQRIEQALLEEQLGQFRKEHPGGGGVKKKTPAALGEGWKAKMDPKSGKTYYYNTISKETQWARPV